MLRKTACTLAFAFTLFTLMSPTLQAQASSSASPTTPTNYGVTGGDPEPISPHIVDIVHFLLLFI